MPIPADMSLPAYAYVPGRHPHPTSDPRGHSYGSVDRPVEPIDPERPGASADFRRGIVLFNQGYYWEAHEVWERLWHAAGRRGPLSLLLQGLIRLAAAGVKAREGNANGVRRHACRAASLLREAANDSEALQRVLEAIGGARLISCCEELVTHPPVDATPTEGGVPVLGVEIDWPPA